jgi:hypothetical protein
VQKVLKNGFDYFQALFWLGFLAWSPKK